MVPENEEVEDFMGSRYTFVRSRNTTIKESPNHWWIGHFCCGSSSKKDGPILFYNLSHQDNTGFFIVEIFPEDDLSVLPDVSKLAHREDRYVTNISERAPETLFPPKSVETKQ